MFRFIIAVLPALFFALPAQAIFDSAQQPRNNELTVVTFSPEGDEVPTGNQIAIGFDRPVVPLGRMERNADELPITLTPSLSCHWRWISTHVLACNLDDNGKTKPATEYTIKVSPGLKAVDGATMSEPFTQTFRTQTVKMEYMSFPHWRTPTAPIIRIWWNMPVGQKSILQHVYFRDSANHRVAAVASKLRDKLTQNYGPTSDEKEVDRANGDEYRRIWYLEPKEALEPGTTYQVAVEPGLDVLGGTLKSTDSRYIGSFNTFETFTFLGVVCTNNQGKDILLKPNTSQKSEEYCDPLQSIMLRFNAPVTGRSLRANMRAQPSINMPDPDDDWANDNSDEAPSGSNETRYYNVSLPRALKSAQTYTLTLGEGSRWEKMKSFFSHSNNIRGILQDRFGRKLPSPVKITFTTDHRTPNLVLDYSNAVLEKNVDSEVPVYVNNLEKLTWSYDKLTASGLSKGLKREHPLPFVKDIQFAVPAGIRDMLENKSGIIQGTLTSTPGVKEHAPDTLFAEVTPFHVHMKLGHFNSLAWVTDLATGQPVADANVTIYRAPEAGLTSPTTGKITAKTDSNGLATLPGTERLDPAVNTLGWRSGPERLYLHVAKDGDIALLPLKSSFQLDGYRSTGMTFHPTSKQKFGHMIAWGTTAQGIYHPGDKIQYKLYIRDQNAQTLVPPPRTTYWLEIIDPTGKMIHKVEKIQLDKFGSASGELLVAKTATVGWYNFLLKANLTKKPDGNETDCLSSAEDEYIAPLPGCGTASEFTWTPMRVLVSDFTPVPFKVTNQLNGDTFHPGDEISVTSEAKLHSGGPYTQAQARITAVLTPEAFTSKNPAATGFEFGSPGRLSSPQAEFQDTASLDEKGELKTSFKIDNANIFYGRLMVESAVQDDRGKYVAHSAYADYTAVDRMVGIRLENWFIKAGDEVAPEFIVVDDKGNPVKDMAVTLTLERKDRVGARVKSSGNAYVTASEETVVKEDECNAKSDATGKPCRLKAKHAGEYTLRAKIVDTHNRPQETEVRLWASGSDYVLWGSDSDNYIEIIADKQTYHIGDTAHCLIKNPLPGAKALISIERYGIIDSFVTTLKDSTPVIDIPIKPEYLPGAYLSVVIMSPRIDRPLEKGQVDLGKPTFRIGYIPLPVKDAYKEINVTATTDKAVYRPGDKVRLTLNAKPLHPKNEPIGLAVAVLDEAVFDLIAKGKDYYDPYQGFYNLERLDVANFSLLTKLIGRQKFEKKGANPGGDGGASLNMRSVIKFVTYWNPDLKTDANGKAEVEFAVPDNLTGWRILAIATTPTDRFGLGQASFKVNRPTEVRPEMPNQVSEHDKFEARFSVMNRTDHNRTLTVRIASEGDVDPSLPTQIEKSVALKPYERALVALPVRAARLKEDANREHGAIRFVAQAWDSADGDKLAHEIPVLKLRSLEVAANYGTTTEDKITEPVSLPSNIFPDTGSVSVTLAPSVIGNLEGAFKYLRDYPYPCWEQKLTRAVMAANFKSLKTYISGVTWAGAEKVPDEILAMATESQTPSGGMAYFIASDDHADPYLSAYTALAFNWLRRDGYQIPASVETKLHDYLLAFLRRDQAPGFYTNEMSSTVRAVALAALAEDKKVDASDIRRYAPHVNEMSLFGKIYFARAAMQTPGTEQQVLATAKLIMAKGNETSGKYMINDARDTEFARILETPLRDNCAALDLFVALGETDYGKDLVNDLPFKMVRTITQTRKGRDHWENTQENIFCTQALVDYNRVYEKQSPQMRVSATFDSKPLGETSFKAVRDPLVELSTPLDPSTAGRPTNVEIFREGEGRLYYSTRLTYAPRDEKQSDTNAGMEIHREYSIMRNGKVELLTKPYAIHQGDVVRVDLFLSLPAARNFVVVDDPIPGGFEAINADLANNSKVDASAGFTPAGGSLWFKFNDWTEYNFTFWSFSHRELLHNAARFYADYLPPGNYHLAYTVQAISAGDFTIMPTLAQEMYDPDTYGKTVFEQLKIDVANPPER